MIDVAVLPAERATLDDILNAGERLLWSGRPGYGRAFFQPVSDERKLHIALFFGAAGMWMSLPFIASQARTEALWAFGGVTLVLLCLSYSFAKQRQYVLHNLAYFITDRRAIVCRRGRNWRFATRVYVVSCPHSARFPYAILPGRPYPSLRVGMMLGPDQVQPFGLGLSHPGQPILWGRTSAPVLFDYVSEAQTLLELIRSCTGNGPTAPGIERTAEC